MFAELLGFPSGEPGPAVISSHRFPNQEITMKTHILAAIRCSLMFTAVAALSLAYPVKANLITNGGFETGDFTGWTANVVGGGVGGTFEGIAPHSGNFQAIAFSGSISQSVATTNGAFYTIDFF